MREACRSFEENCRGQKGDCQETSLASGIAQKHGEKEVILDYFIDKRDYKEEMLRPEKDDQRENEKLLVVAGESI